MNESACPAPVSTSATNRAKSPELTGSKSHPLLALGRLVRQPTSNRKHGLENQWRYRFPGAVPLVIESLLVQDRHIWVGVGKVEVKVVKGRVVVGHQGRRNPDLEAWAVV